MHDWNRLAADLEDRGCAVLPKLLSDDICDWLMESYADDALFRSRVVMARHGFGQGEYKYFASPLPNSIQALRTDLYPPLAEIANRWNAALGVDARYPATHAS